MKNLFYTYYALYTMISINEWVSDCDRIYASLSVLRPELDKTVNIMMNNKGRLEAVKTNKPRPLILTEKFHHLIRRFILDMACIPRDGYRPWDRHLRKLEDGRRVKWSDKTVNKRLWNDTKEAYNEAVDLVTGGHMSNEEIRLHFRKIYRRIVDMYEATGTPIPQSTMKKLEKIGLLDELKEHVEILGQRGKR